MNIDLHCHSNVSDGVYSPSEVLKMAKENGASMLALTDHDHVGGIEEARKTAQQLDIKFITGVEISTSWRSQCIHIVGLNFDDQHPLFLEKLKRNCAGRLDRLAKIANKLEKHGIKGAYEGALAYSHNPEMVCRPHIAQFLVDQGHVNNIQKAFKKWLGDRKPAFVQHEWMSVTQAVDIINQAGGIAVIAHPARYNLSATAVRNLIEDFIAAGGQALEVSSSCHNLNERLNYGILANRYDLYASLGSDFHGRGDFGRVLGNPPDLPSTCKPIWEAFI